MGKKSMVLFVNNILKTGGNKQWLALGTKQIQYGIQKDWLFKPLLSTGDYYCLTHYVPLLPSYRNQSIDLLCKSIDWFLYEGNTGTKWLKQMFCLNNIRLVRYYVNLLIL